MDGQGELPVRRHFESSKQVVLDVPKRLHLSEFETCLPQSAVFATMVQVQAGGQKRAKIPKKKSMTLATHLLLLAV